MDGLPARQQALPGTSLPPPTIVEAAPAAVAVGPSVPHVTWSLSTRVLFRLCVVYFATYVLFTQMLGGMLLVNRLPRLGLVWPMKNLVLGAANTIYGIKRELVLFSGSGDKTYDWVQASIMLTFAVAVTLVWSLFDRRRRAYPGIHKWFYLWMRFALGATMMSYGMAKLTPLQMPFPTLMRLLEPYGNFSPMGVLWYSIGASRPYEIFTGSVEVLAGLLLFIPWTSLAGALVALAATSQVFTLNMTYDVPVKLFSFHLILMSLFLIAPEAKRLLNVLVLDRTAPPSTQPPLARTRWLRAMLVVAQLAWGGYLAGYGLQGSIHSWGTVGGGAPKPPLYGIWMVDEMTFDGQVRPPLLSDTERYRRLVIQSATTIYLQKMDESFLSQPATVDLAGRSITMTRGGTTPPPVGMPPPAFPISAIEGTFTFEQPTPASLVLDGELGGHKVHMKLAQFDLQNYLLMTRGFNWVQEYPFNR